MSLNTINTTRITPTYRLPAGNATTNGGFQGDQWASELHSKFYTLNYNGMVFALDSDSVAVGAVTVFNTKGNAGTIKLLNGLFNPYGSGVNVDILAVASTWTSGTPAGPLLYNAQTLPQGVSLTNAATGTIRGGILNTIAGASVDPYGICAEVGVVIVRSDSAATAFTQTGVHGGPAAIAAGAGLYSVLDEMAGRNILPPGTVWGLTVSGQGTSQVVQSTIWYSVTAV